MPEWKKMDPRVKALWIEALESDEYPQTTGQLRGVYGYCCLGVLCDLHSKETGTPWGSSRGSGGEYLRNHAELPQQVVQWAGLQSTNPRLDPQHPETAASQFNDALHFSFAKIAQLVKENL